MVGWWRGRLIWKNETVDFEDGYRKVRTAHLDPNSPHPFAKSLAQILSRDICFYDIVATRKGYFKTITPTITLAIIPTLTPALMPTLTQTRGVENEKFVSLAGHVTKSVFCP